MRSKDSYSKTASLPLVVDFYDFPLSPVFGSRKFPHADFGLQAGRGSRLPKEHDGRKSGRMHVLRIKSLPFGASERCRQLREGRSQRRKGRDGRR